MFRIPYLCFTFLIWIKIALLRHFLFNKIDVKWWLLDLCSLLVLTGIVELIFRGRTRRTAFWILNAALSIVFFAAALYFQHFGSVATYTSVLEMKQLFQIQSSVKATIEPLDYLFFADFPVVFVVWLLVRLSRKRLFADRSLNAAIVGAVTVVGLVISLWFVMSDKGITNELVRAEQLGLLNYEASVAVNGMAKRKNANFANAAEAGDGIRQAQDDYNYDKPSLKGMPLHFAEATGSNVIVVQMEAFQNFPIGLKIEGHEITPVLNKLLAESHYFPNIFQQIGQGNTSDAEFMSNTSIYPTGTIPMSTGYGDRALPSLPRLLESIGYEADTFHVNEIHFWDRDKLYPAIGFSNYFDKPYYNNDNFNEFGASDEELFRVGAEKLSALKAAGKPFYAQFVTVSSHYPFKVPADRRKMTIPSSLEGKQLGDYLLAVNYTDYAIGTFIDRLKAAGLWDNTIFVAYGDHFGLQPQDNDPKQVSAALGITYDPVVTRYNIPLLVRLPGQQQGSVLGQVGGQLDIMPTVANLLGVSLQKLGFVHLGQDLFNIKRNAFGMRYYMPTGSFFNDLLLFTPGKAFDDGSAVSLKTLQPTDFAPYRPDYDYVMNLMKMSDEYVRLLPKR